MRKKELEQKVELLEGEIKSLKAMCEELSDRMNRRYLTDTTVKEKVSMIPTDVLNEYLFGEKQE